MDNKIDTDDASGPALKPEAEVPMVADKKKGRLRENVEALLIAIALALFIRAFIVQPFKIPSGSMIPTLLIGDQIFVTKFSYGVRMPVTNDVLIPTGKPKRGDIVVFKFPLDPTKDYIKRVVAVENDVVQMRDRKIYINGAEMPDTHAHYTLDAALARFDEAKTDFPATRVPPGKYFVMGDNRDNSNDSRYWGFVDFSDFRGRARVIYWSWDWEKWRVRWDRIANLLR